MGPRWPRVTHVVRVMRVVRVTHMVRVMHAMGATHIVCLPSGGVANICVTYTVCIYTCGYYI